jgi:hypothetical protein
MIKMYNLMFQRSCNIELHMEFLISCDHYLREMKILFDHQLKLEIMMD